MKKRFIWGAGFSAPQVEGIGLNKSLSVWDYWFMESPYLFSKKIYVRNDFLKNYQEDLNLVKELNLDAFSFSIQWSFLIPDGKNINLAAVQFYKNLINQASDLGLQLTVSLFHFDLPLWLSELNGWTNKISITKFNYYAEKCFQLFGDKVNKWITFNEPMVDILGQYLNHNHYPAMTDTTNIFKSIINVIVAHKSAVKTFKSQKLNAQIGIALKIEIAQPGSETSKDLKATELANFWEHKLFLDACLSNKINHRFLKIIHNRKTPFEISCEEEKLIDKHAVDFLTIIYQKPKIIKYKNYDEKELLNFEYQRIEADVTKLLENDLFNSAMLIKNSYKNIKTNIALQGIAMKNEDLYLNDNGIIEDQYRINYFKLQIIAIKKAINAKVNCLSLTFLNYIDNWNWKNAYDERFGIVSLDLNSNVRIPKKSFFWIKEFLA